jgi:endonuclease/exonuclease/phosphatase family metal-dependent hydrolase
MERFFHGLIFILFLFNLDLIAQPIQQQKMFPTKISEIATIPDQQWLDKKKAITQFIKETNAAAQENAKIPPKDSSLFRIMTYNVHYWKSPDDIQNNLQAMINVIKKLNPDVVILQEVSPHAGFGKGKSFDSSIAMQALQALNFQHFAGCNTLGPSHWFGNVIASKTSFTQRNRYAFKNQFPPKTHELRCFVTTNIHLLNKKELSLYGTHLEVGGTDEIRQKQIEEIINDLHQKNLIHKNVIIAADFNATRKSVVIKYLQEQGFKDCFSYLGWQHPFYTNWTGKEIDFIFLSPEWNLPLVGCYVYYDATSDHLPIIMDIQLETPQTEKESEKEYRLTDALIELSDNLNLWNELISNRA